MLWTVYSAHFYAQKGMKLLTQTNHPMLWLIFQYLIGGTVDKRKLCISKYNGEKSVLEVGCSVGNIAKAFLKFKDVSYTGIDIDDRAIECAKKSFNRYPNFNFISGDFCTLAHKSVKFDYVLFSGILHHVDDATVNNLLQTAFTIVSESGAVVVVDPLVPEIDDSWLVRTFVRLEQGNFLRSENAMLDVLSKSQFSIHSSEIHYITGPPILFPKCAKFGVYLLEKDLC